MDNAIAPFLRSVDWLQNWNALEMLMPKIVNIETIHVKARIVPPLKKAA